MPGPLPPLRLGTLICHKPFTEFVLAFMYDPEQVSLDTLGADELDAADSRLRGRGRRRRDPRCRRMAGTGADRVRLFGRTRVLHGRRGSPASADQRPRAQHVHRRRVQPRLEAGPSPGRAGGRRRCWTATRRNDSRSGRRASSAPSPACRRAPRSRPPSGYEPAQPAEAGWKALSTLYEPGPAGDERRDALRKAIELSNYQFNAHGIELGTAIEARDRRRRQPGPHPARDPQLYYQPTTRPGARVPHARLERARRPRVLLARPRRRAGFALLTGVGGEAWRPAGGGNRRTHRGTRPRPRHRKPRKA